jgi:hypothetical protein
MQGLPGKMVEAPGFKLGCRPRKCIRNNKHLALEIVWSIDRSIVDVHFVPDGHNEDE